MKTKHAGRAAVLLLGLLLGLLLFCFSSCGAGEDPGASFTGDFSATLSGERDGKPVEVRVASEGGELSVCYLSPGVLSGVEARLSDGVAVVRRGELSGVIPDADGLLRPLCLLTDSGGVARRESLGEKQILTFENGTRVTFGKDGNPEFVEASGFACRVRDWRGGSV